MAYAIDDIYIDRQGNKYKCTTAGTPPQDTPFNPNNVVNNEIMWGTVGFEKQEISGGGTTINDWESSTSYSVGDLVIYDANLYQCSTAHTSTNEFDSTKWTEISGGSGQVTPSYSSSGEVVLCMPFDQNLNDLCGNVFTTVGTPTLSSTQSVFGTNSLYLDGSSYMYMDMPIDFFIGNADFTLEWWEYRLNTNNGAPVFGSLASFEVDDHHGLVAGWVQAGAVNTLMSQDGGSWAGYGGELISMGAPIANTWVHRVFQRRHGIVMTYADGQLVLMFAWNAMPAQTTSNKISLFRHTNGVFSGYINNLRFVIGKSLYIDDFIPSTTPYTLSSNGGV